MYNMLPMREAVDGVHSGENVEIQSRSRLNQVCRQVGRTVFRAGLSGAFALTSLSAFGPTEGDVGPATIESNLTFGRGGDVVANVGIDNATFDFSDGPLGIEARLIKVDSEKVEETGRRIGRGFGDEQTPEEVLNQYQTEIDQLKDQTIRRGLAALVLGGIGGALAAEGLISLVALQRGRRPYSFRQLVQKASGAVLIPSLLVGASVLQTVRTLHENPLAESPRFDDDGSLNTILNAANSTLFSLENYKQNSEQLSAWLNNVISLQQNINQQPVELDGLVPVLVVSDEHSRPCSDERTEHIVKTLGIKLVFNAGDRTEWGQPLEQDVFQTHCDSGVQNLGDISAEVVAIGGNHDPSAIIQTMDAFANVDVLSGDTQTFNASPELALRVLGDSDPRFTPDLDDNSESDVAAVIAQAEALAAKALISKPDVIVVHDPKAAERIREIIGPETAPLIISGHTHKFNFDDSNGLLTAGSFGASGLRGYEHNPDEHNHNSTMQASVIYFDPSTKDAKYILSLTLNADGSFGGEIITVQGRSAEVPNIEPKRLTAGVY